MSSKSSLPSSFLTAAETDRFINVFNTDLGSSIGSLVAESNVLTVALASGDDHNDILLTDSAESSPADQVLAAITRDGALEIFETPFNFVDSSTQGATQSLKARVKQRTRKAKALVKIIRPNKSPATIPLLNVAIQNHELVLVWADGGVNIHFDRIQWRKDDSMEVALTGVIELVRDKGASTLAAVVMNGVKDMGQMHVDESHTVVAAGIGRSEDPPAATKEPEVIDISSAEEGTDYEEDEEPLDKPSKVVPEDNQPPQLMSHEPSAVSHDEDVIMADAEQQGKGTVKEPVDMEEPTFGELIKANAPGPVDVQAAFAAPGRQALAPASERTLQLPSGMSLGTVLTQSLRTNDVSLLESCLHMRDLAIVRATVERLDSSLASTLIQKLAERFHSRPGRAGSLMVWIQWTIVAHGGYLASQPGAMKTLAALHRVISERAQSLPLLLSLKGKLDMLEAQMNLRATMQAQSKAGRLAEEEDEENVIYVEGQEASDAQSSDSEDHDMESPAAVGASEGHKRVEGSADIEDESEDDVDEMPATTNGVLTESDESESDSEGVFDDEAESTDGDSEDEASMNDIDHEDVDSIESEASDEPEQTPHTKRPSATKLSNGIKTRKQ
ncbi:MAG: hypothetical protein Q9220_005079 [cf. Caloplaca sp. 1 TL-2023]